MRLEGRKWAGDASNLTQFWNDSISYTVYRKIFERRGLNLTYYDKEGVALVPPPAVRVMLICRRDQFVQRVGIGWVLLTKWVEARPKFETVFLE